MSAHYRVFTIKRERKLKKLLAKIDDGYKNSTDSTFIKVYGKSAIIELAIFIEESVKLLCEKVTKKVEIENKNLFDLYKNSSYIQPLKYKGVIKRLFPVYGISHIVNLEKKIGNTDIQILNIELGNIDSWRQDVAHSDIRVPASPDMVLKSFDKILPILRKMELALRD